MSGVAEYTQTGLRRIALPVSEVSIAVTVCLVTAVGVFVALLSAPATTRDTALPVFVLGAGAMFGLGLTDIVHDRELRFARALIVAGVLWSLTALTAAPQSVPYSLGHASQWFVYLAVAYLLLSYPAGRLTGQTSRALFAGVALLLGALFLPTLFFGQFPHPSLWSMCTAHCPRNAFSLERSTPWVVRDVVVPLRDVVAVALFAVIAGVMIRRARRAEPMLGQLYAPIATFAVLQTVVFAVYFPLRALAPHSDALTVVSWIFVLSLPAVALACATSRVYRQLHAASVLERLARILKGSANASDVSLALAAALEDPGLRILHSFPGDSHPWVDESGQPAEPAVATAGRRVTEVTSGNWRIAVLHNASLADDRGLVVSAGSYALAALENQSLTDELRNSVSDLAQSRASRLTVEHDTRQKIERDLHDGAQQRLVALRLRLGLVAAKLERRDPAGAEVLHALEKDVDATIDEVRSLARGIYPPLLARTGLRDALRGASRDAAVPTTVRADHLGRYPPEIETTVYFACSEALQNAAKHAPTATGVTISVWQDGELEARQLHFEVRDDGSGFDLQTTPYGTGLSNLRGRLAAVGGTLRIRSAPGQGTVLEGSIPVPLEGSVQLGQPGQLAPGPHGPA